MTATVSCPVHFVRRGRGASKQLRPGVAPEPVPEGRVLRVARLLALALHFEERVRRGEVENFAALARAGEVSRARVSQVLSLVHLAPDIQEAILFWPRVTRGRDPLVLRDLLPLARQTDWAKQRKMYRRLDVEPASPEPTG